MYMVIITTIIICNTYIYIYIYGNMYILGVTCLSSPTERLVEYC